MSFFTSHPHFPKIYQDSIHTIEFLNASQVLVSLIEQFGFGFEPVKDDLSNNIKKLLKKYNENTEEYKCLMRMILLESQRGERFATESLLWLRRGLSLLEKFMSGFLENERKGIIDENMSGILNQAYENSLKSHHGFCTRILFNIVSRRCPSRTRFLEILGYAHINDTETFLSILKNYLNNLQSNLEALVIFCKTHNIEPHH